ncbi:dihydroneopterin aldolase, partial [Planktomarina sp.]|nr:dihydroneopterin aldolase [Planktomarina sp.]
MTADIETAFGNLLSRAQTSTPDHCDRISVRDHIIEVEIGAFQTERGNTQRIRFNVVVEVQPVNSRIEDDVDKILSYDRVTEAIEG